MVVEAIGQISLIPYIPQSGDSGSKELLTSNAHWHQPGDS